MSGASASAREFGIPYEHALRTSAGPLMLRDLGRPRSVQVDVERFLSEPDAAETALARLLPGPVLDIGCGPGRMVRAAIDTSHRALGVDVSGAAVAIARDRGLPAVRRSVFEPLPDEGEWGSALLLDGNIGIGGDPARLVSRCTQLLRGAGRLIVETHPDGRRDHRFHGVLSDAAGTAGPPFPWAEVGHRALRRHARSAGLELVREWQAVGRRFAEYARPVDASDALAG